MEKNEQIRGQKRKQRLTTRNYDRAHRATIRANLSAWIYFVMNAWLHMLVDCCYLLWKSVEISSVQFSVSKWTTIPAVGMKLTILCKHCNPPVHWLTDTEQWMRCECVAFLCADWFFCFCAKSCPKSDFQRRIRIYAFILLFLIHFRFCCFILTHVVIRRCIRTSLVKSFLVSMTMAVAAVCVCADWIDHFDLKPLPKFQSVGSAAIGYAGKRTSTRRESNEAR